MAFSDQSKTVFIPSLESLCLTEYLAFLESACAGASIVIFIIFLEASFNTKHIYDFKYFWFIQLSIFWAQILLLEQNVAFYPLKDNCVIFIFL